MKPRGILIAPYHELGSSGSPATVYSAEPTQLRKCVLYWDRIDLPLNVWARGNVKDDDYVTLNQAGILDYMWLDFVARTNHNHTQNSFQAMISFPQQYMEIVEFLALNRHKNSDINWTIGRTNSVIDLGNLKLSTFTAVDPDSKQAYVDQKLGVSELISKHLTRGASIELEISNALPVAGSDVPMAEVLEFKQKRQDELTQFRHAWDRIILEVIGTDDPQRAVEYHKDSIDLALTNIHRVMDESRIKKVTPTITANIVVDISAIAKGAIAGAVIGHQVGMELVGSLVGVGLSAIGLKVNLNSRRLKEIPSELKDYAYLYHVKRDLTTHG